MATSVVSTIACWPSARWRPSASLSSRSRSRSRSGASGLDAERLASGSRAGVATARCLRLSRAAAVFSTKKAGRGPSIVAYGDDDEDDDDDFDDEAAGFADMEEWMRSKPAGFGLRAYDTVLEDRLLEEIEADNQARAAAIAGKKAKKSGTKSATAVASLPPAGVEVYVGNLPKKRKVDRDLRTACGSARGLLHIRPVVGGSEKTRDPTCKGLAFLTLATESDAEKFIDRFNGKTVSFGNLEKKLIVELASHNSPFKKHPKQNQGMDVPRLAVRELAQSYSKRSHASSSPLPAAAQKTDSSVLDDERPEMDYDKQYEHVRSVMELENDLLEAEQEVWTELEDENDFELDEELEEVDGEHISAVFNVDEGVDLLRVESGGCTEVGRIDGQARGFLQDLKIADGTMAAGRHKDRDIEEVYEDQMRSFSLGHRHGSSIDAKDKKIQELESQLKALQLQLSDTLSSESMDEKAALEAGEKRIEALEKRLLFKARKAERRDSKPKSAQKISIRERSGSGKSRSKDTASQSNVTRLGAASRLKKKERKLFTNVVSKYSSSTQA